MGLFSKKNSTAGVKPSKAPAKPAQGKAAKVPAKQHPSKGSARVPAQQEPQEPPEITDEQARLFAQTLGQYIKEGKK